VDVGGINNAALEASRAIAGKDDETYEYGVSFGFSMARSVGQSRSRSTAPTR
jgi:hypothetical protein